MQDLSNIHEYVTERTNDTGVVSPILEIQPDDGLFLRLFNQVARGSAAGIPIYGDFKDSNGNDLPQDTSLRIEFERPSDEQRNRVSEVRDNIQTYRTLSLKDQQDEEFIDAVKLPLLGQHLTVRHIDTAYISIESNTQIDWANSALYIEGNAVTEGPMN